MPPAFTRIAICGPMASGKSHLANHLVTYHGYTRVSLANGVKQMGHEILESLVAEGVEVDPTHKYRRMLQVIGMGGRRMSPNLWIEDTLQRAEAIDGPVVVDDLRFINEAKHFAAAGWAMFRLVIDEDLQKTRLQQTYPGDWKAHWDARDDASESEISHIPQDLLVAEIQACDGEGAVQDLESYLTMGMTT